MNMLYGNIGTQSPPADENIVRMTTAPVDVAKEPAEMDDPPVMGEVETDSDPMLGMASRQLASDWHESEKYAPFWAGNASQQAVNNVPVNSTQASNGTAASRELAGQYSHGTMAFAVGIEPTQGLMPGGQFGNEYFARDKPNIQEPMGFYMKPPLGYAHGDVANIGRTAEDNARKASQASLYNAFLYGEAV